MVVATARTPATMSIVVAVFIGVAVFSVVVSVVIVVVPVSMPTSRCLWKMSFFSRTSKHVTSALWAPNSNTITNNR